MDLRLTALSAIAALALVALWPAQATATHVQCGEVITQDTKLDNDLLNCPPDLEPNPPPFKAALTIGADNVTLDLNGHTIGTTVVFAGTDTKGIDDSAGHSGLTVKNGTITGYERSVLINGGADDLVTNVNLSGRGGVEARNVSGLQITRSDIPGGALGGIAVEDVDPLRIEDNVVTGAFGGISVFSENPSARIVIRRNVLDRDDYAISLGGGSDTVVEHNSVTNSAYGIYAHGGLIRHNLVERNWDGIRALGSAVVSHNTANYNFNLGIEADPSVIDGGGNKAKGNANPLQCLNVFCK
jgi:hypothetical protein